MNEEKPAGEYEVEFSAKGRSLPAGRHGVSGGDAYKLSSGIYFDRLKAEDYLQTKKMILLK